jgi:hypothetical protein
VSATGADLSGEPEQIATARAFARSAALLQPRWACQNGRRRRKIHVAVGTLTPLRTFLLLYALTLWALCRLGWLCQAQFAPRWKRYALRPQEAIDALGFHPATSQVIVDPVPFGTLQL